MLRLSKASVNKDEISEIEKVFFGSTHFGLGKTVEQFECNIKDFLNSDYGVVAVNTGTSALHLALEALNFPHGSEVLVPSITFAASYVAIKQANLVPISCEVQYPNVHICPRDLEKRITNKTVAIMPVAYSGTDFDRFTLYQIAKRYNLRVIEDDAHAFGSLTQNGKSFGSEGDIICFSFDGIKNITCGEGGAILTSDKNLEYKLRIMRSLGIEKDVELRYKGQRAWEYDLNLLGYRYHMSNINAAIGIAQLAKFSAFFSKKQQLVNNYINAINYFNLKDKLIFTQKLSKDICFHIFSCLLPKNIDRKQLMENLKQHGIETGFHYVPNHLHTLFKANYSLPIAEEIGSRLISLPFHVDLSFDSPEYIIKKISEYI